MGNQQKVYHAIKLEPLKCVRAAALKLFEYKIIVLIFKDKNTICKSIILLLNNLFDYVGVLTAVAYLAFPFLKQQRTGRRLAQTRTIETNKKRFEGSFLEVLILKARENLK